MARPIRQPRYQQMIAEGTLFIQQHLSGVKHAASMPGVSISIRFVLLNEEANNEIVDFSDNDPVLHIHQYGSITAK